MITVTRIGPGCRTCTSGSETYAWVVKEDCFITPVASTGSVIAESTRSTLCLGPLMVIIAGSAVPREGQPAVRRMMTLTLTFDHRAVDGAPAARFLARLRELLERPYLILLNR